MKERRTPIRRDRDPNEPPHARIPDALYELLRYLSPFELKLWIALKCRERRKERRGLVRKTLRRIAKDIDMPWTTTRRAMKGLLDKGLAEWAGAGIRVLNPDFTTAFPTGVTTSVISKGQRNDGESGPTRPGGGPRGYQGWAYQDQEGHLVPFPSNGIGGARSVFTDPADVRAARRRTSARDALTTIEQRAPREKARASARSSRALSSEEPGKEKPNVPTDEEIEEQRKLRRQAVTQALEHATVATTKLLYEKRKKKLPPEISGAEEERRIEELRHQAEALRAAETEER